ncbi:FAD-dependent oxidoreductase [Parasulfuritortus cantonensis]|uniref:FAD-dependent oxidoreductase n=1 Tax=Parasulfuritortus cantonensis TaxID=2528202 RepID=A0A4R1B1R3_9PROT|nr:FAD-dependent monooxygenase [Parasulfuritortus cantonensis]TCJ11741.1 FAD-dependent oxidoreductase [Parasulfuritortus cantonensis]
MVNATDRFDIVIVGGGLTGTAFALALRNSPYRVALVEPRPPGPPGADWDARVYAYSPGNVDWLRGLGGWAEPVRAQAIHAMRIFGDAGGRLSFDALETGLPELAWIAENGRLQYALWQAAGQVGNIELVAAQPEAVAWGEAGRHRLVLADGRELVADLLVGADGASSWLRDQAGIGFTVKDQHQAGVVANFETEKPHRGIAWQWFAGDSVLAYLPLPGRRISIVWSTHEDAVPERIARAADDFAADVAAAGQHVLGELRRITPQAAFPLKIRRAREWVRPGLALIGDAAHTVHPLAGQGVNLGFRDCRLLAEMLAAGGNPGDIGRLQAYAVRRLEDVASMQFTTGGLKSLFTNPDPMLRGLRNAGLGLTNGQDWLKQALMRHAVQ